MAWIIEEVHVYHVNNVIGNFKGDTGCCCIFFQNMINCWFMYHVASYVADGGGDFPQ